MRRYPVIVKANPKLLAKGNSPTLHILEEPLNYVHKTTKLKKFKNFDEERSQGNIANCIDKMTRSDFYQMVVLQEFA